MRIVCVTHAYPRFEGDVAGAFIEHLLLALTRRGHTVAVVAPADQGKGGRELRHGIIVERVRYAPAAREILAYRGTMMQAARTPGGLLAFAALVLQLARATARLARAMPADLVHAHWWVPAGVSAWLLTRLRRDRTGGSLPYAVTLHGTDVALLEHSGFARGLARTVLGRAAAVTAVSPYLADRVAALTSTDRHRIAVCPMPVNTAAFTSPDAEAAVHAAPPRGGGVVTVGRLTSQKRINLLIEAIGLLAAEGRAVRLSVVGDGPERGNLERRATELGLHDLVRFTGQLEPPRVADVLRRAAVFAFPAAQEGFGLAAVEALMLGVPVIAARDGGGAGEVVAAAGGGGRLVDPDPPSLARAIRELLEDPTAPGHAGRAGAELQRRLAPDAVARVFEGIFGHVA